MDKYSTKQKALFIVGVFVILQFLGGPLLKSFYESKYNSECQQMWTQNLEDFRSFQSATSASQFVDNGETFLAPWLLAENRCFRVPVFGKTFYESNEGQNIDLAKMNAQLSYFDYLSRTSIYPVPRPPLNVYPYLYKSIYHSCQLPNLLSLGLSPKCSAFLANN